MLDRPYAWKKPRSLSDCYNIYDVRELARQRMPESVFNTIDGGAETEITAARNIAAFDKEQLVPRYLVDVSSVKTSTRILGQEIEWPVYCSPAGGSRAAHPDGELAVARASARAGTFYGLGTFSSYSLEEIAAATTGPKMFQLYFSRERDMMRELIERCKQARYQALCLTVDTAVNGKRERELRAGLSLSQSLSVRNVMNFVRRPGWFIGQARKGAPAYPNMASRSGKPDLDYLLNPSITWEDVRWLIELWGGPFALKGIMSVHDARLAVEVGATAVVVSNHGGRQLDGAATSFELLPKIAEAVGDRVDIILDGGIRRGVHVLKALARGAKACTIGRPFFYGLGAGGEAGVTKVLDLLRAELVRAMQLSGCTDVQNIDSKILRRFS